MSRIFAWFACAGAPTSPDLNTFAEVEIRALEPLEAEESIRRHLNQLRWCYAQRSRTEGPTHFEASFTVAVDTSGRGVATVEGADEVRAACFEDRIHRWQWSVRDTTVSFRAAFAPVGSPP